MPSYEIDNAGYLYIGGKKVEQFPTPNMSGVLNPVAIIDHDTASNPDNWRGPVGWLQNPAASASAHVCISWDGKIRQLVPFTRVAWHAGASSYGNRYNYNGLSVGIEHDNPGWLRKIGDGLYQGVMQINTKTQKKYKVVENLVTKWHPAGYAWMAYSDEQLEASTELHRALKVRFSAIDEVLGHYHICPGRKTDVNPLFPLEAMQHIIRGNAGEKKSEPVKSISETGEKVEGPNPGIPAKTFAPDATVTADWLNLRSGPGTGYAVKGGMPMGTRLDIVGVDGVWLRVVTPGGYTGYVHGGFVRKD